MITVLKKMLTGAVVAFISYGINNTEYSGGVTEKNH
jgi:hypothetical protein